MVSQISNKVLLKNFERFYERLVEKALTNFQQKDYQETLKWITGAASAASEFHPGRFSDARLEDAALKIGKVLDALVKENVSFPTIPVKDKRNDKKRVLHAATQLYKIGGHTRLIINWIKKDTAKEHWLVITQQGAEDVPAWVAQSFEENGGRVICLPDDDSILKKALILRKISQSFDFVILHHHSWDVIPLLAFAVEQLPPVAVMNHADHVFWLGVSVADLVLDLRSYGAQVTLERRRARQSRILPIPLETADETPARVDARRQLGIDENKTVLLTIGSEYKYSPTEKHDFFKTAKKILDANPSAEMYIIGPKYKKNKCVYHERMHYLGMILNPALYEKAADIYLEGFPMSSFTALLETVKLGVCPVLMYEPNRIFAFDEELALKDLRARALDEDDYVKKITELIASAEKRKQIAEATKKNVVYYHCATGWKKLLGEVYTCLEQTRHNPQLVEETETMTEEKDYILVKWKRRYFQLHDQPLRSYWFSKSEIYNQLTMKEFFFFFREALRGREINSLADIKRCLVTVKQIWKRPNSSITKKL